MMRGETDIDAAATLLGFRASFADEAAHNAARQCSTVTNTRNNGGGGGGRGGIAPSYSQASSPPQPPNKVAKFPTRLMEMLADEEHVDCISWLPHGRSFIIHDPDKFTKTVLPKYFRGCKFSSFTRKLYRWGFRQISKGPDADSFFHKLFRRDKKTLCERMICKEEIRDGCPELHEGINAYSLMRMEQSDKLQELIQKKQAANKKIRLAALQKQQREQMQKKNKAKLAAQRFPPPVASSVRKAAAPAPAAPTPHPPPARVSDAILRKEGSIGLVRRHLEQIEQRRADLNRTLKAQIQKMESRRRYVQLLASQGRLEGAAAAAKLNNEPMPAAQIQQARSPVVGPAPGEARLTPKMMQTMQADSARVPAAVVADPTTAPIPYGIPRALSMQGNPQTLTPQGNPQTLTPQGNPQTLTPQGIPRRVQSPAPDVFSRMATNLTMQEMESNKQADVGIGSSGAYYPALSNKTTDVVKNAPPKSTPASSSSGKHDVHMLAPQQSAHALNVFKAALAQKGLHTPGAGNEGDDTEQNIIAAGVIKRALESLRREGLA